MPAVIIYINVIMGHLQLKKNQTHKVYYIKQKLLFYGECLWKNIGLKAMSIPI